MDNIHALHPLEIKKMYEEGKVRLKQYLQMRDDVSMRLERAKVLEMLGLKNERRELEIALHYIEKQISLLKERNANFDQIFTI